MANMLADCIDITRNSSVPWTIRMDALLRLKHMLHDGANQNSAAELGIITDLLFLARDDEAMQIQALAFDCLIELCFDNEQTSTALGSNPKLVNLIVEILENPDAPLQMKRFAITSSVNPAGNSWKVHPQLVQLAPSVVNSITSLDDQQLQLRGCLLLCNLSYNDEMLKPLEASGCIPILEKLVLDRDASVIWFIASLTLANLIPDHPFITVTFREEIVSTLIAAFERVTQSEDYPPGSGMYGKGWKLASVFSKICQNQNIRQELRRHAFIPVIESMLSRNDHDDARLVTNNLKFLWIMSQSD